MKVAPKALRVPLALWERAGVRETSRVTATIIPWGGAGAMGVRAGELNPVSVQLPTSAGTTGSRCHRPGV